MRHGINEVPLFPPDRRIYQHKAGQRVRVIKEHHIADAPGDRGQVELYRDQHDQHHAPPEDRHGVTGQRQANGGMIENGTALNGSQDAYGNAHGGGENHGADTQFQRRFKARHELVPHR